LQMCQSDQVVWVIDSHHSSSTLQWFSAEHCA